MIELEYSLIIEATAEPDYFGFYSPDLEGFSGIGNSIEDCIYNYTSAKYLFLEYLLPFFISRLCGNLKEGLPFILDFLTFRL